MDFLVVYLSLTRRFEWNGSQNKCRRKLGHDDFARPNQSVDSGHQKAAQQRHRQPHAHFRDGQIGVPYKLWLSLSGIKRTPQTMGSEL